MQNGKKLSEKKVVTMIRIELFHKNSVTPCWGYQWKIPGGKVKTVGIPGGKVKTVGIPGGYPQHRG